MDPHSKRRFSLSHSYFSFLGRRKISDRLIFTLALIAVFATGLLVIFTANNKFLTSVPTQGGMIAEGIIGTPRFVNPVLAITRADHDMVALVYSGLLKIDEEGNLVNDLAESVDVSEDGKTYHVVLRKGVHFHNGAELKARDVAFTIGLIQNPDLKSPLRGNWDGVTVKEVNDYELDITLEEAYAPFKENLTVGILPRELWDELPIEQIPFSQNNTQPIGTGPYRVEDALRSKAGLINAYKLTAFDGSDYKPNITTLVFNFYQNEDELLQALANKEIASTPSLSPESLGKVDAATYKIIEAPLPRTFGLYFNQNRSALLRDASLRKALDAVIDKEKLVDAVLYGYGIPTDSPIPPGFDTVESTSSAEEQSTSTDPIARASALLTSGGWTKNQNGIWEKKIDGDVVPLSLTITTANTPLFAQTASSVADAWKALGAEVTVSQFEQADLVQSVIRPREYEVLLYGADVGRQIDLYPFWHSSQKNDPGLNIAAYANIDVDALLHKSLTEQDTAARAQLLQQAASIIQSEAPAIFLFAPTFAYVLDADITATPIERLSKPSDRFANIAAWHIRSDNLWPIFSHTDN
jgi:peptide/nickel transport system substrate-binding protein